VAELGEHPRGGQGASVPLDFDGLVQQHSHTRND
jgi:hypothetical protein